MKIPKTFEIVSQKITVHFVEDLALKQSAIGQSLFNENKILIQANTKSYPVTKEVQEHTFWHELVHFLLYYMNSDLNNNEAFVDLFGNMLHQVIKTSKYK